MAGQDNSNGRKPRSRPGVRSETVTSDPSDKSVPSDFQGKIQPNYYCRGWNAKRQKYCRCRAGQGTDHLGVGRCINHGGGTSVITKSGRYSSIKNEEIGRLAKEFAEDPEPLNLIPDLHQLRALYINYINRYSTNLDMLEAWYEAREAEAEEAGKPIPPRPKKLPAIEDAYRILSEISKVVKRVEDIGSQNMMSRPEFFRLMHAMGHVVENANVIEDPEERLLAIREGWRTMRI